MVNCPIVNPAPSPASTRVRQVMLYGTRLLRETGDRTQLPGYFFAVTEHRAANFDAENFLPPRSVMAQSSSGLCSDGPVLGLGWLARRANQRQLPTAWVSAPKELAARLATHRQRPPRPRCWVAGQLESSTVVSSPLLVRSACGTKQPTRRLANLFLLTPRPTRARPCCKGSSQWCAGGDKLCSWHWLAPLIGEGRLLVVTPQVISLRSARRAA